MQKGLSKEQKELMNDFKDGMEKMNEEGKAECAYCNFTAYGNDFGEMLEKLGRHGERFHPEKLKE